MSVRVPKDYFVQFTSSDLTEKSIDDDIIYTSKGNIPLYSYTAAIAKYQKVELETGIYYFLPGTDKEIVSKTIDPVMTKVNNYMQKHFGERKFPKKIRVVEIPDGFGNFAVTEESIIFQTGIAFSSVFKMMRLAHEFIHLGWNAKVEDVEIQHCRFFDEAFTSYFEYRVLVDIVGEKEARPLLKKFTDDHRVSIKDCDLIPIKDYGAKGYGGLSYTIGAFCLYKLSVLVGEESFHIATKEFLNKYKDIPVNFEIFCEEYKRMFPNADLESFFQK
jgi:hypothetical protein